MDKSEKEEEVKYSYGVDMTSLDAKFKEFEDGYITNVVNSFSI